MTKPEPPKTTVNNKLKLDNFVAGRYDNPTLADVRRHFQAQTDVGLDLCDICLDVANISGGFDYNRFVVSAYIDKTLEVAQNPNYPQELEKYKMDLAEYEEGERQKWSEEHRHKQNRINNAKHVLEQNGYNVTRNEQ